MIFEFDQQPKFMQEIDIEDIGNVALRCSNRKCQEFYIIVKTYLGKSALLKFGPIMADLGILTFNMDLSFKKFDYKESTIVKEINKCLNDGRNEIDHVAIISEYEALAAMPTADAFINCL
jgi:hypothetical protein